MLKKINKLGLIIALISLTGCSSIAYPIRAMDFESKTTDWKIEYYDERMLFANDFKALYEIDKKTTMELRTTLEGTYYTYDEKAWIVFLPLTLHGDTQDLCIGEDRKSPGRFSRYVEISFLKRKNDPHDKNETFILKDVTFDSNKVYFVKDDGKKIFGEDTGIEINDTGIYKLDSELTLNSRPLKYTGWKDVVEIPVFYYSFPLTCTDYENATLVIDGLYYKGKQIPPLKVHMKYHDFSKVPEEIY